MPTILITGANRGIGNALASAYLTDGWQVFATARHNLRDLPKGAQGINLDVSHPDSIKALKDTLGDTPIDILWNNAGVYLDKNKPLQALADDDWLTSFSINTIAPIRIAEALVDNVSASDKKAMVFTSSLMGSISTSGSGAYAYRSSKSALNMAVRCLAKEYASKQITCTLLHPGHVKTDMGGETAPVMIETSVSDMKHLVEKINPVTQQQFNGSFLNHDGSIINW